MSGIAGAAPPIQPIALGSSEKVEAVRKETFLAPYETSEGVTCDTCEGWRSGNEKSVASEKWAGAKSEG